MTTTSKRRQLPTVYRQVLDAHRARLQAVTQGPGLAHMKRIYTLAQAELEGKLRALAGSGRGDTFTALQAKGLLAQVRQGQMQIAQRMAGQAGVLSEAAQNAALRGLVGDIARLNKAFTGAEVRLPIEQAARFQAVVKGRATSLLNQHTVSMRTWGAATVDKIKDQMSLSMAVGETTDEAVARIAETASTEWWRAERIVRTETAWAYSAAEADGIRASREALPDLRMRWVELCDDETGAPLDARVAVDSIALHGQVSDRRSGLFVQPATAPVPDAKGRTEVPEGLVGLAWPHPPNRPNDRALVQPWRPGWGVPAYELVGGERSDL